MVSLLVVSDLRLLSETLADRLAQASEVVLTGVAAGPDQALLLACQHAPDIILVERGIANAIPLVRSLAELPEPARVVVLGLPDPARDVIAIAEAGASGYVPADATLEQLLESLLAVAEGGSVCPPTVTASLFRRLAQRAAGRASGEMPSPLTARERQIARMLDEGLSNKEVAQRLGIEVATVKNHVHNLLAKLGAHRRSEAVARMRQRFRPTPPAGTRPT